MNSGKRLGDVLGAIFGLCMFVLWLGITWPAWLVHFTVGPILGLFDNRSRRRAAPMPTEPKMQTRPIPASVEDQQSLQIQDDIEQASLRYALQQRLKSRQSRGPARPARRGRSKRR
jgi:hypothetical protein